MRPLVAIIDYGVGNVDSVRKAIDTLGCRTVITNRFPQIEMADALILPGVGAFHHAMRELVRLGLVDFLAEQVLERRKPTLGICLGMQILATSSEEDGHHQGLGWIPGHVRRIAPAPEFRVPHVGWNQVQARPGEALFARVGAPAHFYFDHSYHFTCDPEYIAATCDYSEEITAVVRRGNIHGVQFHPEKSQSAGLKLFRGFLNLLAPSSPC